jgi:hypothetical protein
MATRAGMVKTLKRMLAEGLLLLRWVDRGDSGWRRYATDGG